MDPQMMEYTKRTIIEDLERIPSYSRNIGVKRSSPSFPTLSVIYSMSGSMTYSVCGVIIKYCRLNLYT